MIVRIVKMTFLEERTGDFIALFEERKQTIKSFEGCTHLELWQDSASTNVFFTYSHWKAEEDLDHYRFSTFFKETWTMTKKLFAAKPEAWSVVQRSVS